MADHVTPIAATLGSWEDDAPELNLRVLVCVGRYLRDHRGPEALTRATRAAGLDPYHLDGKTRWIEAARFEALLRAVRAELHSDEEFFEANLYQYAETQGLIRFLITLSSPVYAYERGCQMFFLASRVSQLAVERLGNRKLRFVYTTTRPESRLTCLSRMSSLVVTPTLWGLPRARIESKKCVADGDDVCEYELTVYESPRWLPAALGAVTGGGVAALLSLLDVDPHYAIPLAPLAGALIGHVLELGRVNRHNIATGLRSQELLRALAEDDADARRELMAIQKRQGEWLELMEEQLAERSAALQEVVDRIRTFQRSTQSAIQGLSHDLRNPLQVLVTSAEHLSAHKERLGPRGPEIIDEHIASVQKIQRLLTELMQFVTTERVHIELTPEPVDVTDLTERMRRQLRALLHGKPIRSSVFRVREAPDEIVVDAMVLDRIVDNLLSNAAKYTQNGSIIVEVAGTPGFLTLKISDTGRGMEAERLERAFVGGATEPAQRQVGSYGIGLSVVVDLLGRIGGRLEVMSKPNVGTTFWVHVPVQASERADVEARRPDSSQVLTIRRSITR